MKDQLHLLHDTILAEDAADVLAQARRETVQHAQRHNHAAPMHDSSQRSIHIGDVHNTPIPPPQPTIQLPPAKWLSWLAILAYVLLAGITGALLLPLLTPSPLPTTAAPNPISHPEPPPPPDWEIEIVPQN